MTRMLFRLADTEAVHARRKQARNRTVALRFAPSHEFQPFAARDLCVRTRSFAVEPRAQLIQVDFPFAVAVEYVLNFVVHCGHAPDRRRASFDRNGVVEA
ncbi:hypothetical protein [Nocardia beijingensis]